MISNNEYNSDENTEDRNISTNTTNNKILPSPSLTPILNTNINEYSSLHKFLINMTTTLTEYDKMPSNIQTYFLMETIKRSNTQTLQNIQDLLRDSIKINMLFDLPNEIKMLILFGIDIKSLFGLCRVNKYWNCLINNYKNDFIDSLWLYKIKSYKLIENNSCYGNNKLSNQQIQLYGLGDPTCFECDKSGYIGCTDYIEIQKEIIENFMINKKAKYFSKIASLVSRENTNSNIKPCLYELGFSNYKQMFKNLIKTKNNWYKLNYDNILNIKTNSVHVITCMQSDAKKIVTGSDDSTISIHDIKSGKLMKKLEGHEGGVWCLQYIMNVLVSGSTDRSVRVWNMELGICTHILNGHTSTVRCMQLIMPEVIDNHCNSNNELEIVPCWPMIITGSRDATLRVWRLPTALIDRQNKNNNNDLLMHVLRGHTNSVRAVSACGSLIVSGSYDHSVRVWDIATGECKRHFIGHTNKVYTVVYDSKREICASGSLDATIRVWDIEKGVCKYVLEGHESLVGILKLNNNNLVSAAADSTVRIWDINTGKCVNIMHAFTSNAVTSMDMNSRFIACGLEGAVKVFDIKTGKIIATLIQNNSNSNNVQGVWQINIVDLRYCVVALQKQQFTCIEVFDFNNQNN